MIAGNLTQKKTNKQTKKHSLSDMEVVGNLQKRHPDVNNNNKYSICNTKVHSSFTVYTSVEVMKGYKGNIYFICQLPAITSEERRVVHYLRKELPSPLTKWQPQNFVSKSLLSYAGKC